MEKQYLTVLSKLSRAVSSLATGPENIRGRLPRVYLILADVSADELPEILRENFEWVMSKLTAKEPRYSGPYIWETTAEANVAAIRTKTAVKIAHQIVYIEQHLRHIAGCYH